MFDDFPVQFRFIYHCKPYRELIIDEGYYKLFIILNTQTQISHIIVVYLARKEDEEEGKGGVEMGWEINHFKI